MRQWATPMPTMLKETLASFEVPPQICSFFPEFTLEPGGPRHRSPHASAHLPFQNYQGLLIIVYQQLTSSTPQMIQLSGCNPLHTSNNRLPQTSKRLSPAGGEIDHETQQLLIRNRQGEYSPR